jgi:aspartate kinase
MNIDHPDKQGTLISTNTPADGKSPIKVIAAKDGIISILIKSSRMLFAHGFLNKVFEVFDQYKTSIDMITTSEIGVSVTIDNSKNLEAIIDDLKSFGTVSYTKEMTIISVIGNLPENSIGIQSDALSALKEIPIRMISYGGSAHNISFLVRTKDKSAALQALNKQLFGV